MDRFLTEIDHEQYVEWCQFFDAEPIGFPLVSAVVTRLTWAAMQSRASKQVKERDYEFKLGNGPESLATTKAQHEAASIQSTIAAKRKLAKKGHKGT